MFGADRLDTNCELLWVALRYTRSFRIRRGMPQDGLASDLWSYFPSLAPDGCSIRLQHSDTFCSNISRSIAISVMMSTAVGTGPFPHI
jgi:hypothetical protein